MRLGSLSSLNSSVVVNSRRVLVFTGWPYLRARYDTSGAFRQKKLLCVRLRDSSFDGVDVHSFFDDLRRGRHSTKRALTTLKLNPALSLRIENNRFVHVECKLVNFTGNHRRIRAHSGKHISTAQTHRHESI